MPTSLDPSLHSKRRQIYTASGALRDYAQPVVRVNKTLWHGTTR